MIQATTQTNFTAYVQTRDNTIDTSVELSLIKHLYKFTNDMDRSVYYAYPSSETINNRFTKSDFLYNTVGDVFEGKLNLKAGFYKYEVYEVSYARVGTVDADHAPATENFIFDPNDGLRGVVQGLVTKGKMYVSEKAGTQEVTYSQNGRSVVSISIVSGGAGYTSPPTIEITGGGFITQATATCDVAGGAITEIVITNAGNGYTSTPRVELSGGGFTTEAQLVASIQETNYIYTG
tara:strand:- start:1592 stop:2296 length:705 start_codon:yes stop_codon:yes gene_type:complete